MTVLSLLLRSWDGTWFPPPAGAERGSWVLQFRHSYCLSGLCHASWSSALRPTEVAKMKS